MTDGDFAAVVEVVVAGRVRVNALPLPPHLVLLRLLIQQDLKVLKKVKAKIIFLIKNSELFPPSFKNVSSLESLNKAKKSTFRKLH